MCERWRARAWSGYVEVARRGGGVLLEDIEELWACRMRW